MGPVEVIIELFRSAWPLDEEGPGNVLYIIVQSNPAQEYRGTTLHVGLDHAYIYRKRSTLGAIPRASFLKTFLQFAK